MLTDHNARLQESDPDDIEGLARLYLCSETKGPFRRFMVARSCLSSYQAVKECVAALGFTLKLCFVGEALVDEHAWLRGLGEINCRVAEQNCLDEANPDYKGDENASQIPADCTLLRLEAAFVDLYPGTQHHLADLNAVVVAQHHLTSYQSLHFLLRRLGLRPYKTYIKQDGKQYQVHHRAWPPKLTTLWLYGVYCCRYDINADFDAGIAMASDKRFHMNFLGTPFEFRPFTGEFSTVAEALNATLAKQLAEDKDVAERLKVRLGKIQPNNLDTMDWLGALGRIRLRYTKSVWAVCFGTGISSEQSLLNWCIECPSGSQVEMWWEPDYQDMVWELFKVVHV
ncbi:hypothetical protein FN846DRAFT_955611 [Sphaerosporella brunnea]|uniref:Uncharacterized protein n=1 Tax=Sphaerosporella brunnea TaxID=1250544 RepID=A0A5J5ETQ1_9PEZI|nr:hypothetical protein FN846DRAFT_955611 [Sphaerosporella brunnea]